MSTRILILHRMLLLKKYYHPVAYCSNQHIEQPPLYLKRQTFSVKCLLLHGCPKADLLNMKKDKISLAIAYLGLTGEKQL